MPYKNRDDKLKHEHLPYQKELSRKRINRASERKSQLLGMSWGVDGYRLKKMVMLHLIKQLGLDVCFRCGKPIESPNDLSLDHKKNWINDNVELFWDVENIAFSHTKCNKPHL